jgi:hypothetical protein
VKHSAWGQVVFFKLSIMKHLTLLILTVVPLLLSSQVKTLETLCSVSIEESDSIAEFLGYDAVSLDGYKYYITDNSLDYYVVDTIDGFTLSSVFKPYSCRNKASVIKEVKDVAKKIGKEEGDTFYENEDFMYMVARIERKLLVLTVTQKE